MMLEIIVQGRGGQGAQTAGNLLAQAFFAESKYVQAFSTYGGARRGTSVSSFLRVDDKPIRLRCSIERPTAILCFDSTLLNAQLLKFADRDTLIVVNSQKKQETFVSLGEYNIVTVDGIGVARRNKLGNIVNSALVGAFAAIFTQPSIDTVVNVVKESVPAKRQENVAACLDGYQQLRGESCILHEGGPLND